MAPRSRDAGAGNGSAVATVAGERTPLLGRAPQAAARDSKDGQHFPNGCAVRFRRHAVWLRHVFGLHVEKRILLAGFLITLSFSFTQVP